MIIEQTDLKSLLLENRQRVLSLIIIILGIIIGVYLVRQQQILKSRAAESPPKEINITPSYPAASATIETNTTQLQIKIDKSDFEK